MLLSTGLRLGGGWTQSPLVPFRKCSRMPGLLIAESQWAESFLSDENYTISTLRQHEHQYLAIKNKII